jgi:hypothetical protein
MTRHTATFALVIAAALWGCAAESSPPDDGAAGAEATPVDGAREAAPLLSPSTDGIDRSLAKRGVSPGPDCNEIHPLREPEGPVPDPWRPPPDRKHGEPK